VSVAAAGSGLGAVALAWIPTAPAAASTDGAASYSINCIRHGYADHKNCYQGFANPNNGEFQAFSANVTAEGQGSAGDSGTDPAYGIGARLKFGSFEVRAEYEYFDVSISSVDMISASAVWTF
jgi:hypothetical protein